MIYKDLEGIGSEDERRLAQEVFDKLSDRIDYIRLYNTFHVCRDISIMTPFGKQLTVREVYSEVQNVMDSWDRLLEPMPMVAITDESVEMINHWHLDKRCIHLISDGAIKDKELGVLYTTFVQW